MAILASFLGSAALVIWLLGGFSSGMKAGGGGLVNDFYFGRPRLEAAKAERQEVLASLTEEMQEHLSALGVTSRLRGQFRASFYAVIDQGQLVQEGFSPDQQVRASGTLGNTTYAVLSAGSTAGSESSIVLNGIEYDQDGRGLNIVVYDRQTGTCIDSVCFDTCSGLTCTR